MKRNIARPVLIVFMAIVVSVATAFPAVAHSGKGSIKLIAATPTGALRVRYEVTITFTADGHLAPDAVSTIVAEAEGVRVGPVPLTGVVGRKGSYEATVNFPSAGVWAMRFSSLDPTAILERTETIVETVTTVRVDPIAETASTAPATTTVARVPDTASPTETVVPVAVAGSPNRGGRSRSNAWVGLVVVLAGTAAAVAIRRTRRKPRNA